MRLIIWIKFENETVKYKAVFFFDLSISHKRFYMVVHVLFLFPSYHVSAIADRNASILAIQLHPLESSV